MRKGEAIVHVGNGVNILMVAHCFKIEMKGMKISKFLALMHSTNIRFLELKVYLGHSKLFFTCIFLVPLFCR